MSPRKNDSKVFRIAVASFRSDTPYHTLTEIAMDSAENYHFVIIWAYSLTQKKPTSFLHEKDAGLDTESVIWLREFNTLPLGKQLPNSKI